MATVTLFAALTAAIGDGLAAFGGARITRLTAPRGPGDSTLPLERTAGLPVPGAVSIGRVTYRYARISGLVLADLAAQVGGTSIPGVVAQHPAGSAVLDVSGSFSTLDDLRASLFLDTATGADLAALGRSLGVQRSPSLSSDDQYRAVIKALAYARRGTVAALSQLLDAIVGPGGYQLVEDPFKAPGQVQVIIDPAAQQDRPTLGRTYVSDITASQPSGGAFAQDLPAFGHGALRLAELAIVQDSGPQRPSAASPAGLWAWSGADESTAVALQAEAGQPGPCSTLVGLTGAYRADPPELQPGSSAQLSLLVKVVGPASLASDPRALGARLHDRQRVARWGARAGGAGWQLAIVDDAGAALSPWVAGPADWATISLALSAAGASLRVGAATVARVARASLPAPASGDAAAAFGNLLGSGQPAGVGLRVRTIALAASHPRDYWLGAGEGGRATGTRDVFLPGVPFSERLRGHALWLSGPASAAGARGRYIITECGGARATLRGVDRAGGALVDGGTSGYFTAPADDPFVYPDDIGKVVVVTSGGALVQGSYTVAALYDPGTGADLAQTQTPGATIFATRARLATAQVTSGSALSWRLDPAFAGQTGLSSLVEDYGTITTTATQQLATPARAILPSAQARYTLPRRRVLGGVVRAQTRPTVEVADAGPPPRLTCNPFYATSHTEVLDAYLPGAAAGGVQVVVTAAG